MIFANSKNCKIIPQISYYWWQYQNGDTAVKLEEIQEQTQAKMWANSLAQTSHLYYLGSEKAPSILSKSRLVFFKRVCFFDQASPHLWSFCLAYAYGLDHSLRHKEWTIYNNLGNEEHRPSTVWPRDTAFLCMEALWHPYQSPYHPTPVMRGWTLGCFFLFPLCFLSPPLSLNLSFSLPTPLPFWLGISHSFASPGFSVAQPCRAHCFLRVSVWSVPRISAAWDSHSLAEGSTVPHSEETVVQCGLLQLFPKTLCEHCCWENPWGRREECSEVPPAPDCISFAGYWVFLFFLCCTVSSLLLSSFFLKNKKIIALILFVVGNSFAWFKISKVQKVKSPSQPPMTPPRRN